MMAKLWNDIPLHPRLTGGDCQVWLAWLDKEAPGSYWNSLSNDEQLRAGRLRRHPSADRFIAARGILRALLSRYIEASPDQVEFSYGAHGKPELAGGMRGHLSFNVSHSGGLAVFAIARGLEVGVDIEEVHPISDLEATASIFLSHEELGKLMALPNKEKLDRFFALWTCKEAILKAFGSGFSIPVRNINQTLRQPDQIIDGQNVITKNKRITFFNPANGFKGALARIQLTSKE